MFGSETLNPKPCCSMAGRSFEVPHCWAAVSSARLDLIRFNVTIAIIKGVAIVFCCRTGKIPYEKICFLTSFEPNKVYLGPNRNKGVAIILLSGRKRPDFN